MDVTARLYEYISLQPVFSTHSHHLEDGEFVSFGLDDLLRRSYVSWCGAAFGDTTESRGEYLSKVR